MRSISRSRSMLRSTTTTSASMPAAICAAFQPAIPPPSTTTFAGITPEAPPISTPRPPCGRSSSFAPTCGAIRPAISDIGPSSGSRPSDVCTVSYAMARTPRSRRNRVSFSSAARCRNVNSTWSARNRSYSSGWGSLTFTMSSAWANTASASGRISPPTAAYCSSAIAEPSPAPVSTTTRCPAWISSRAPSGVAATRYSWFLTSFGIPTITGRPPGPPGRRRAPPPAPAPPYGRGPAVATPAGRPARAPWT